MKRISPLLFSGFGSWVYALIKTDGQMQSVDSLNARLILLEQGSHGVQAVHAFQLCEHYKKSVEEAYLTALQCFVAHKKDLTDEVKEYFIHLMMKIVRSDNRITVNETRFFRKFKTDLSNI